MRSAWALLWLTAGGLGTGDLAASSVEEANAACHKCHAVPDLTVFDPRTDRMVILTVDPAEYRRSVHGALACAECHPHGYDRLPHYGPLSYPRFLCVSCHQEAGDIPQLTLEERREELLGSAHGREAERDFTCHTCHDPHLFRLVRDEGAALERIRASNRLCLDCHGTAAGRKPSFEDLPASVDVHGLFPNPRAHFRKLKCVSCHTGEGHSRDHDVLTAIRSVRECSECHGQDAPRFEDSYANAVSPGAPEPSGEAREDVYVIGSSRSEWLDLVGLGLLTAILALTAVHALARQISKGPL
ncbi:MAG: hypothetical protein GY719_02435 [bacterium]|nr:hypothetical protein [bacterium]